MSIKFIAKVWKSGDRYMIPLDDDAIQKLKTLLSESNKELGKDEVYLKIRVEVIK